MAAQPNLRNDRRRFNVVDYCLKNKPCGGFFHADGNRHRSDSPRIWDYRSSISNISRAAEFENAIHDYYVFIDTKNRSVAQPDRWKYPQLSFRSRCKTAGWRYLHQRMAVEKRLSGISKWSADGQTGIFRKAESRLETHQVWGDGGYYARVHFSMLRAWAERHYSCKANTNRSRWICREIRAIPINGNPLPAKNLQTGELYKSEQRSAGFDGLFWWFAVAFGGLCRAWQFFTRSTTTPDGFL